MSKPLTAAAVEKYKPDPDKRRVIKDGGATSLFLVIYPSGKKSWMMRFRRPNGGEPVKIVLGSVDLSGREQTEAPVIDTPLTLAAARALAASVLRDRKKGVDVIAAKKTRASTADKFGALVVEFVRDWKTKKHQTRTRRWRGDAALLGLRWPPDCEDPTKVEPTVIKDGLADKWRDKAVADIDGNAIHGVVDGARKLGIPGLDRRNDGVSENRGRKMHSALSVFFRYALRQRKVTVNPCASVERPGAPRARKRVLTDAEIKLFFQATGKLGSPFGPLLRILILTGQRLSEVSGMRRNEIRGDEWMLPGERTKNHLEHVVPLSPLVMDLIAEVPQIENCPFVFSTTGKRPVSGWSKTKARLDVAMLALAKKDDEKATIAPWTLHDLRRSAVTGMNEIGIFPHIVEACVNHISGSRGGVAGHYNYAKYAKEKRDALECWGLHVQGLVADNVVRMRKR